MLKHPHTISLKRFKPVGAQPPIEEVPVQSDDQKPRSTPCANQSPCTVFILGCIIWASLIAMALSLYFLLP
jgi:hypothetical protein